MNVVILSATLFAVGHCDIREIIRRNPVRISAAEEMLGQCLQHMAKYYHFANSELEMLVQDEDFNRRGFTMYWNRVTLDEGLDLGVSFNVRMLRHYSHIQRVLRKIRQKRNTLFMIVFQKTLSDEFYVELSYQTIDFEVVTAKEIQRDFPNQFVNNQTRYVREMKHAFRRFWKARIPNVIALVPNNANIYFYTYFPYSAINCPDKIMPVLTNIWFSDRKEFYHTHNLFPDKVNNVYLCPLNVSLIASPPGVMAEKGTIDGIEGEMLKHVFQMLNATPKFHFVNPQEVHLNDSETAMNYLLENVMLGESEFGAGFLIPTTAYNEETDDIHVGLSLCLTWAVPKSFDNHGGMNLILDTFTDRVWISLIFTLAVSSLILRFLLHLEKKHHKDAFIDSTFQVIASALGKAIVLPRRRLPKAFLIFCIWCFLILGSAFQAGLGSNNILSGPPTHFESTRQIVESGFEIAAAESTVHLFNDDIKLIRRNGKKLDVEPMDIHNALLKVAFERRTAYVGLRLAIIYCIQFLHPELMDHIYVHRKCLVNYQPFFALRKRSPFSPRVKFLVSALIEGGFKDKLEQKYLSQMNKIRRKGRRVISKGDALARGSLYILAYGWIVSGAAFVGECIYYYIKRLMCIRGRGLRKINVE